MFMSGIVPTLSSSFTVAIQNHEMYYVIFFISDFVLESSQILLARYFNHVLAMVLSTNSFKDVFESFWM